MPPKATKKPQVFRNKKTGKRYVKIGKKKINIPKDITQRQLIQWLITYLKPKRKKAKASAAPQAAASEPNLADDNVRNVFNHQRAAEGKPLYDAPVFPKGPVPFKAPLKLTSGEEKPQLKIAAPKTRPMSEKKHEKEGKQSQIPVRTPKREPLDTRTQMQIEDIMSDANKTKEMRKERDKAQTETHAEKKNREETHAKLLQVARREAFAKAEKFYSSKDLKERFLALPTFTSATDTLSSVVTKGRLNTESEHTVDNGKIYIKPYLLERLIKAGDPKVLAALAKFEADAMGAHPELTGSGILDVFGIRTGPSPAVRKFLEKNGAQLITHITVARQPITPIIDKIAGWLSFGKWQANKKKLAYDKMMHLFLVVTLESGLKFDIEKNHLPEISSRTSLASTDKNTIESLTVAPTKSERKAESKEEPKPERKEEKKEEPKPEQVEVKMEESKTPKTVEPVLEDDKMTTMPVELAGSGKNFGTLIEMIAKAQKLAGGDKLWVYDSITQNCQFFAKYCIQATGSLTPELTKFIMQDAAKVIEGLSWFQKIARGLTNTKNLIDVAKNGRGENGPGITNFEIDKFMATYRPHYLGSIARDQWQNLTPPVHKGWSGWIMNTDKADKGGRHWVAFFLDLKGHTIEYYDSFADDIPDDVLVSVKAFLDTYNVSKHYLKLKVNRVIDQSATSDNCGYFAMRFIIDRSRGKAWRECTKFDESVKNEEAIKKFKEKFGEFKYL